MPGLVQLLTQGTLVTWQSRDYGKVQYLDVNHGLLRFARNDGRCGLSLRGTLVTWQSRVYGKIPI
ncbi:hypothetical protein [Thiomicrorhabdus sp. Kp2]|uniref:hypothetical protein n=1 Tax=Thiomicrorhabdus sp. Kp2 TaxID=1123518 RepID=UPI00040055F6|nr:hypothetical protein [Thiomicrorhabdus sp. Kp2]